MTVMHVRGVRVGMFHTTVLMPMGMWFTQWVIRSMLMLMMLVMDMAVLVVERLVPMLVLMPFGEMQVEADRHQQAGADQRQGHRLAEHQDGG